MKNEEKNTYHQAPEMTIQIFSSNFLSRCIPVCTYIHVFFFFLSKPILTHNFFHSSIILRISFYVRQWLSHGVFLCIHGYLWFSNWALLKFENRFYWGIIQQITPDSTSAFMFPSKPSILEPWNKPHPALNSSPVTYYILGCYLLIWVTFSSPLVNQSVGLPWIEYKRLKQPGAAPSPIVVLETLVNNEFMPWGAYFGCELTFNVSCLFSVLHYELKLYSLFSHLLLTAFFSWAQNIPATVGGQCTQNVEHLWSWLACIFPMTWPCHCHLEAVRGTESASRHSLVHAWFQPSSVTWKNDGRPPGGFQQPAAGWRRGTGCCQRLTNLHRGWLRGAVPGLYPRGLPSTTSPEPFPASPRVPRLWNWGLSRGRHT